MSMPFAVEVEITRKKNRAWGLDVEIEIARKKNRASVMTRREGAKEMMLSAAELLLSTTIYGVSLMLVANWLSESLGLDQSIGFPEAALLSAAGNLIAYRLCAWILEFESDRSYGNRLLDSAVTDLIYASRLVVGFGVLTLLIDIVA